MKGKLIFFGCIFLVVVLMVTAIFVWTAPSDKGITIYGADAAQMAFLDEDTSLLGQPQSAYLQIVLTEATEIYAQKHNCNLTTAAQKVLQSGWQIYTYFDTKIAANLQTACQTEGANLNVGAAITSLEGNLLAAVSQSTNTIDTANYAAQKNAPHSAFKPLAVYAPALEQQKITWSSMYTDSPYSTIKDANGQPQSWPVNATGKYSMTDTTVAQAVSQSLNTVAVKALADFGVNNAISFLEKQFSINLEAEKQRAQEGGEDEIIGNIALGSIQQGCSAVDMAGYYQIFATGGTYTVPKSIQKICDDQGGVIYERQPESRQVISAETAQVMNEMLQTVVKGVNGTGRGAYCKNVPVAGKTGTGDDNSDNWFVGVTPQYSCAVWHAGGQKNVSPKIFSAAVDSLDHQTKAFSTSPNVTQKIYCLQTGNLAGKNCKTFDRGYYSNGTYVGICEHNT